MATTATLESPELRLDAGGEATVPLHIQNTGTLVEGYRLQVVGAPAQWATVEPAEISLYPGDSTTATLAFRPPRSSSVPAGSLPYGVMVVPTERPTEAVVPEGSVEVLPFLDTTAELIPRNTHGPGPGRHQVAIDNRGNTPVTVILDGGDPAQALDIEIGPEGYTVNPGNAAFADVRVEPHKRLWRGAPITHPFVVNVLPQDGPPVQLDGTYVQEPTIPKWLPKALMALLALVALLAVLWFLALKPAVKSEAKDAAKDAVKGPVSSASKQASAAQSAAASASKQAAAASSQAASASAAASTNKSGSKVVTPPSSGAQPFRQYLSVQTAPNGDNSVSLVAPQRHTLNVTDLDVENPHGDFGTVTLSASGQPVLQLALENFRDTDYHYVSPIVVPAGANVTMQVHCARVGKPVGSAPTSCSTAVLLNGTQDVANPR
jgi:hypothetical protein